MINNNEHRSTGAGSIHYRVYSSTLRSLEGAGWSDHDTEADAQEEFDAQCRNFNTKRATMTLVVESVLSTHSKT